MKEKKVERVTWEFSSTDVVNALIARYPGCAGASFLSCEHYTGAITLVREQPVVEKKPELAPPPAAVEAVEKPQ